MTMPQSPNNKSLLRKPLTGLQVLLALAVIGIMFGVLYLFVGSDYLPAVAAWQSKRALQRLFQNTDRFEVYTNLWPGEINKHHFLGVVTRKENPTRWEAWINDLGKARRTKTYAMSSGISLRLFKGTDKLGEVLWLGSVRQMTPVLPGRRFAQVEFDSTLHTFLTEVADPGHAARVLASQEALQDLFRRADRFEVRTAGWPGEERTMHLLGVVSRKDYPKRWQGWVEDLRVAREGHGGGGPDLIVRLFAGREELGDVAYAPASRQMAAIWPDRRLASLEVSAGSSLPEVLVPFERQFGTGPPI